MGIKRNIYRIIAVAAIFISASVMLCGCTYKAETRKKPGLVRVHVFADIPDSMKSLDGLSEDLEEDLGGYVLFTNTGGGLQYYTYLSADSGMEKDIYLKRGYYKVSTCTDRTFVASNYLETRFSYSSDTFHASSADNQIELNIDNADEIVNAYEMTEPLEEIKEASFDSGKIQLNGKVITFPITLNELIEQAFSDEDISQKVTANDQASPGAMGTLLAHTISENSAPKLFDFISTEKFGTRIIFCNDSTETKAVGDCNVIAVDSYRPDFVLPGGINRKMSWIDVHDKYGSQMVYSGSPFTGLNLDLLSDYSYGCNIDNSTSLKYVSEDVTAVVYCLGRRHQQVQRLSYECTKDVNMEGVKYENFFGSE